MTVQDSQDCSDLKNHSKTLTHSSPTLGPNSEAAGCAKSQNEGGSTTCVKCQPEGQAFKLTHASRSLLEHSPGIDALFALSLHRTPEQQHLIEGSLHTWCPNFCYFCLGNTSWILTEGQEVCVPGLLGLLSISQSESEVAQSYLTLWDLMDYSLPHSSIHGCSRQEYWSGLPYPSPGDLPNPGIEPGSPTLQVDALPSKPPGKPYLSERSSYSCLAPWLFLLLSRTLQDHLVVVTSRVCACSPTLGTCILLAADIWKSGFHSSQIQVLKSSHMG